ncbi:MULTISPECIES: N-6 DNA methylase [unclassified Limnobacter]|uniref:N-6 DNA methylase n=1 Tax=unclassified Limnobacter TaxID=2630203 RepID=UPI000C68216D|nr:MULTISPECIES: N-6 DNA methylase [unclassified Limnobacter]MAZ11119.1 hypothetical protein [Sutterellaceae bacterium]|tara:strand:- start:10570 stop:13668 length:3099 start_codon:yes stop_codon:yes gene_type:complete
MIKLFDIEAWLTALSFVPTTDRLTWTYTTSAGYVISVAIDSSDPCNSKISFGSKIVVGHKGVCNFKKLENFVGLECVIRLLEKGYSPSCIELEKTWPSGHSTSGRLDILLFRGKGAKRKSFAMIECKQWGTEYSDERNKMLKDGGQLFSYAIQEPTTEYLTLYASTLDPGGSIKMIAEQVHYAPINVGNQEENYTAWDKSFQLGGLLSDISGPYLSSKKNLKKEDLIELDQETGQGLFNSFAEILRRHAISDKSNAFNKIFNLFVCKICDEDCKSPADELDFQWKIADTAKALIETRLSALYIKGLKDYLQVDIENAYFSPLAEFSFIDTYDLKSYERNASVIREVVELLQPYQIKYTQKHQFLGDFFEDLLNSGIKQEAGQFFTPTIVARFFLKSVPVHSLIESKIKSGSSDILPYLIDYSCGAGHFLTEAIDEIQQKIDVIDPANLVGRYQKKFLAIKDNFYWAKDYIYGIEKDYRLAKTTKIAMFLYGDGDAVIINGDGLDDFNASKTYKGLLKINDKRKYLEQFDVVVSNPPFSISGFKSDIPLVDENFTLGANLGLNSSEIECLFIERCGQLLKPGGYMGLILPLSILNNEYRVYQEARKLLLVQFEIAGLVEMRDKTFKPTNTTTVGIFGRKRSQDVLRSKTIELCQALLGVVPASDEAKDAISFATKAGVEKNIIEHQAAELLQQLIDKSSPLVVEGCGLSDEIAIALIAFLNDRKVALVFTGDKKEQEAFLGYRYSSGRGRESVEELRSPEGELLSSLYDENNLHNPEKANAHILAAFDQSPLPVPIELEKSVKYSSLNQLLCFKSFTIENPSTAFASDTGDIESNSPFGDFIDDMSQVTIDWDSLISKAEIVPISGLVYSKKSETPRQTNNRVLTASNLCLRTGKIDTSAKLIYLEESFVIDETLCPQKGDIVISKASGSLKHLGKAIYIDENLPGHAVGGFLMILRFSNEKLGKAIFYRLLSKKFRLYVASLKGQNINNIDLGDIQRARLTIPLDLDTFYKSAIKKEAQLKSITKKLTNLRK